MIYDFVKLAFRSLKRRKLRSWLTLIGIFIGIAAVVSLIGLGEGLRAAIMGQFGFLGPDILAVQAAGTQLGTPGKGAVNPLSDKLVNKIKKIEGVEVAFNRYLATIKVEFNNIQDIAIAVSSPEKEVRKVFIQALNIKTSKGRMLKDGDVRRVVLGSNYAEKDNKFKRPVKVGDNILLNGQEFEVVGILEKKGSFMFDNAIVVNEGPMLDYLREDDGTTDIIGIKVKDLKMVGKVKEDVEKLLRKERGVEEGEEDFTVQSPQKILESLESTLFAVQLFVYIIASISLLVGGIGIMNTMYTAVVERTKEIGIMKSIGAKNSTIFTLFFIESGLIGSIGGILGAAMGIIMAMGLAFAGRMALGSELIRADISIWLVLGSIFGSFLLGSIFGVIPAIRASKLNPVDALRHTK